MKTMRLSVMLTACLLAPQLLGCGGSGSNGPKLGTVRGTIQVNGSPVAGLTIYFEPAEGATSVGATDATGQYKLEYPGGRSGAVVGPHVVRIQGRDPQASDNMLGEIAAEKGTTLEELKKLPVIPSKYNENSELSANVESGSQELNFDLEI